MSESWLIRRILRGDKRAGEEFVTAHYPAIFRLLRFLTGKSDIAEDLTQQTFVRAWQSLATFRSEAKLSTWLHRIAYHEYTHWLRDRHEHLTLDAAAHLTAPERDEEWSTLVLPQALAQLTPELREAFLLFHVQELSIREAASLLEIPSGTVKSRLFTARLRLRELLEPNAIDARPTVEASSASVAALSATSPQEVIHELSAH